MLLFEEYILASDDDLEIASDIVVGFDDDKNPSYVDAQFKEILEFILDCGVHYRLKGSLL